MAKLKSLVEAYKEKENLELEQLGKKRGRPKKIGNKKVRLNFSVDEDFADDLKILSVIRKKSGSTPKVVEMVL